MHSLNINTLTTKIYSFMKEIILRLKSDTPVFWKKVQKLSISLATTAITVLTVNSTYSLALPSTVITSLGYAVAIGAAIAGTAQLTQKDTTDAKV